LKDKVKETNIYKKITVIFMFILFFLCITAGVFYGAFNFIVANTYSSYEKGALSGITEINKVNDTTSTLLKSGKLDTAKIIKDLPDTMNKLTKAATKISELTAAGKYTSINVKLEAGISSNIDAYREIIAFLSDPATSNATDALSKIQKDESNCLDFYSEGIIKDKTVAFSSKDNGAYAFISAAISYLYDYSKQQKSDGVAKSQNETYINSIDDINSRYLKAKTDYFTLLSKVRQNNGTYEDVLNKLSADMQTFQGIQQAFTDIKNLPTNYKSNYQALGTLLTDYSTFLQDMQFAITTEEAQAAGGPITQDIIDSLYKDANSKLKDIDKDATDFGQKFQDFKISTYK